MKILMINVSCGTGSTGRICTDLAEELEKMGHEVKIAYGRDQVQPQFEKYAVRIGSNVEIKLHALYARLFDASGLGSKKGTKRLIRWIREYNPDIIHLHNIHGYYVNVPILFSFLKSYGKPIIWTLHDCWCFTGHAAFCDSANCEKYEKGCGNCPLLREYPASFVDCTKRNWLWKKNCFTNIPNLTLITPSIWLAEILKKTFMSEYPVSVIHNGIDINSFFPLNNDFKEYYGFGDKIVLLGVSSIWNDMKEYNDYIELSKMLDQDMIIVLVGLSCSQIKELPDKIIGIEKTDSQKELRYIYNAADVVLDLTKSDNFITTYIEEQAHGTPIISYNAGRRSECTGDKIIVVEQGNIEQIYSAIKFSMRIIDKDETPILRIQNTHNLVDGNNIEQYKERWKGYFRTKAEFGLVGKRVILGVASVWDNRKGLESFISLYSQLSQEEYAVILVGLSKKQVELLPSGMIGKMRTRDIEELRILYSLADVFFNPTIEDNYPTTNIEAACCGTPVITYCTGGSPESVDKTQIVRKYDIEAVKQLLSRKCYLNVKLEEHFNKAKMKDEYLYIYNHTKTCTEHPQMNQSTRRS